MGKVEHKTKAFVFTSLRCGKVARNILQASLRASRPRTTCHDIVVECSGSGGIDDRLVVRADCTTPKSKDHFEAMAEGYAASVKDMLK
jgi:hypothetical protein